MAGQEVFRHGVHRRPFLVLDFFLLDPVTLVLVVDQLHGLVDLFEQVDAVAVSEMLQPNLDDGERHLRQVEEGLIAMHPHPEIHLGNGA